MTELGDIKYDKFRREWTKEKCILFRLDRMLFNRLNSRLANDISLPENDPTVQKCEKNTIDQLSSRSVDRLVDRWNSFGRIGSNRVVSGRVGLGWVGKGRIGSGRLGSGQIGSG